MLRVFERIWENFKEYIVLVILLTISLITLSFNDSTTIKNVRAVAFGSFAIATSVVSDLINTTKIKSENERLRRKNAELMLQVNKLREYAVTNSELKRMAGYKDSVTYPLLPAKIVSKSFSTSHTTATINAGKKNGVEPGMPVVNDAGLVGIVHSTSDNYSIIRTLENLDLKLTVKDERSRIDGIMKYNGSSLVMIDVPKTYDVEPGDRIITSDLSSIISIPIPVGVVKELSKVKTGIFNEVMIEPYVNFARVEYVFVIGIVESKQKNNFELNFYKRQ